MFFVEYTKQPDQPGYRTPDRPLNIRDKFGKKLSFMPNPDYADDEHPEGRRIHAFNTEEEASYLLDRFRFLDWANDVLSKHERDLLAEEFEEQTAPLEAKIEDLQIGMTKLEGKVNEQTATIAQQAATIAELGEELEDVKTKLPKTRKKATPKK